MEVTCENRDGKKIINMNQTRFIESILKRFGMENCKPTATPATSNLLDDCTEPNDGDSATSDREKEITFPYQEVVGSLLYLSTGTRPDISQAVAVLSRFMANHQQTNWKAAKRVLRYLKGTKTLGLTFGGDISDGNTLKAYVDADWAGDLTARKSTSGIAITLNGAGITWLSKQQSTVALSTLEAEYIALCSCCQEVTYFRNLVKPISEINQTGPIIVYEDNQGCIAIATNPVHHSRTKHIDVKYHYIRQCVEREVIKLEYLPTNNMIADIFTKPLQGEKFLKFRNAVMGIRGSI